MPIRTMFVAVAALAGAALTGLQAKANDSQAELGLGGLTLTRSDAVRMVSEDLRISAERITVDYVFENVTGQDVETLVAFPLPDFENVEKFAEIQIPDYRKELDFRTTIDGRPAALQLVESASLQGQDVTARLKALSLPIMPVYDAFGPAMKALSAAQRAELVAAGLVEDMGPSGDGPDHDYLALWKVSTSVTRRQVFPAGRALAVSHSYKPFVGGSVGGRLTGDARRQSDFREVRAKYCIDDAFLRALDRRLTPNVYYGETWISYVLVSGANWAGPIGRYRLTVDKGAPGNLVSFCESNVRKIDDRRFEVVRENFTPTRDMNVLIVQFHRQ